MLKKAVYAYDHVHDHDYVHGYDEEREEPSGTIIERWEMAGGTDSPARDPGVIPASSAIVAACVVVLAHMWVVAYLVGIADARGMA